MKSVHKILSMILMAGGALASAVPAHALPAEHYASQSVLAEGRWARIKVAGTGMHLITDAELRKLGFTDPTKVRVYGRGGQETRPGFTATTPDDLPLQPSIRTQKGILFYGSDHITWSAANGNVPYTHSIHGYSHDNYYFLSDIEPGATSMAEAATTAGGSKEVTDFTARLLHEQELEMGGESGRQMFGEDFRTKRSQSFDFKRVDAVGDDNIVKVRFGAKTTNGSSTLTFKANGQELPSTASDKIKSVDKVDYYFSVAETVKKAQAGDENFSLTIDYEQTGTLFFARLDYIELFYQRRLAMRDGELNFYGNFSPDQTITVSGCSADTKIWDVTDPCAPKLVNCTIDGGTARFGVAQRGYREFIAFDPERISRTATADAMVTNQNIHGLPTPDMVIITLPEYREGSEMIARLHEETDGFRVHVLNAQDIYNEFSGGKPDFGAFRNLLKMWYDRGADEEGHAIGYCLLMGRPFYDNKRVTAAGKALTYNPLPIYESYSGTWEHDSFCTDDYIAKLGDTTDTAFDLSKDKLHVAVGRWPVTNSAEAIQAAEKIASYVKTSDFGPWRNKVMIIADDGDSNQHLTQGNSVYNHMRANGTGRAHVYDRIFLDSYQRVMTGRGPTYPQATERMLRNYNDGVMFTDYIGHGSPVGWCHEHLWNWEDITTMTNKRLTFILSATCRFGPMDEKDQSGAEVVLMNPTAGAIGLISTSRTVYISDNGRVNNQFAASLFKTNANGTPRRFGDVYKDGKNGDLTSNTLRFIFMGDPAVRVPGGTSKVAFTSINGTDITNVDPANPVLPELTAKSSASVEGQILLPDGSVDTGFNGNVTLDLYDAERVITTYGQGDGFVTSYNDRDKKLSSVTLKVTDGHWSGVLRVPPEIQGNYSPAMIAGYAWTESGREAAGTTENLYVYGFNNSEDEDDEAPVIEQFYVNTPNFENGGVVNSNPVIYAVISDESGINISDSGIGHSMTLTIDNNSVLSDLNSYYTQDPEDPSRGTLMYPVSNIATGKHSLTLTVWDNANNVAKSTLDVNVGAAIDPVIYDITASVNDTYVDFNISLDRPNTSLDCDLGVFDLNGRRLWSLQKTLNSGIDSTISTRWDMTDEAGTRVPRGIYIYRALVQTPEGTYTTKSKKIAIAAPK